MKPILNKDEILKFINEQKTLLDEEQKNVCLVGDISKERLDKMMTDAFVRQVKYEMLIELMNFIQDYQ